MTARTTGMGKNVEITPQSPYLL